MTLNTTYRAFAKLAMEEPLAEPEPMSMHERRKLRGQALEDRRSVELDYLSNLKILSATQRAIIRRIDQQLRMTRNAPPGAQDCTYLMGPTGTGKSTAVLEAAFRLQRRVVSEHGQEGSTEPIRKEPGWTHDLIPVIWVTVRSGAKGKAAAGQVRSFLMEGEPRGTQWQIENELPKVIPRHGVVLIAFDDVHNLGTKGAEAEEILQAIKNMETELGMARVAFVFLGNPDSKTGQYNLLMHEQLGQRLIPFVVEHFELNPHNVDDPVNEPWVDHLLEWEERLHCVLHFKRGDLASKMSHDLWSYTQGSPGALYGVLKRYAQDLLEDDAAQNLGFHRDRLLSTPLPAKYDRRFRESV